jgi:hypothetical protein
VIADRSKLNKICHATFADVSPADALPFVALTDPELDTPPSSAELYRYMITGELVAVGVAVNVRVAVCVLVIVLVGVRVRVAVRVGEAVCVRVIVAVGVAVPVTVTVCTGVEVSVTVAVFAGAEGADGLSFFAHEKTKDKTRKNKTMLFFILPGSC